MEKSKLKIEAPKTDVNLLRDLDSNIIVNHLEENIKLREMSVEKKLKQNLLLNQKV